MQNQLLLMRYQLLSTTFQNWFWRLTIDHYQLTSSVSMVIDFSLIVIDLSSIIHWLLILVFNVTYCDTSTMATQYQSNKNLIRCYQRLLVNSQKIQFVIKKSFLIDIHNNELLIYDTYVQLLSCETHTKILK